MDAARSFLVVLPYLTAALCLGGFLRRLVRWNRAPHRPSPLFPVADSRLGAKRRQYTAICLLRGRRPDEPLTERLPALVFHWSLALLAVGHIRAVTDFPALWAALGLSAAAVDRLSGVSGTVVGCITLAALLTLTAKRLLLPRLRQITRLEDMFALALLVAVVGSGLAMRLLPDVELAPIRVYLQSLLTLHPRPMPTVPGFAAHLLLVQLLAVYAPFGKLLHIPGIFGARTALDGDTPGPA